MKNKKIITSVLKVVYRYLLFFGLTAFIISCCLTLFGNSIQNSMNITFSAEDLQSAAKLTFINVLILSALFTAVDAIRRKVTLERPVKKITEAAKKITEGDFSVRIPSIGVLLTDDNFAEIAECFNKMAEELSGLETLRIDFISNVSHEFKTPLAVIQNYVTLLGDSELSEEKRKEYLRNVSTATQNLSTLVTNILKLNKLENQQIFPQATVYNLSEQLCECLLNFESAWEKKSLEIETEIEDDVYVKTDAEMLTLVWNNLFANAVKFTDEGGTVRLSLKKDGEYAVIDVSDTGCGISAEVGSHIFDKFYQGDTSHSAHGNGLGLTLVKRVIDITESEISVASELGRGTTFTVKIRRAADGEI